MEMKAEIPDQPEDLEMTSGGAKALETLRGSLSAEQLDALASFFKSINSGLREGGIGARFPVSALVRRSAAR